MYDASAQIARAVTRAKTAPPPSTPYATIARTIAIGPIHQTQEVHSREETAVFGLFSSRNACEPEVVHLEPRERAPAFTSHCLWTDARIGALAMYCSDGRWGEAFDEFCQSHLRLPRYDRFALPGGPIHLVGRARNPEASRAAWDQIDLLVRVHQLQRLVLIAHYGCAVYAELMQRQPAECLEAQLDDLHDACDALRERFPRLRVEPYFGMREGPYLSFYAA